MYKIQDRIWGNGATKKILSLNISLQWLAGANTGRNKKKTIDFKGLNNSYTLIFLSPYIWFAPVNVLTGKGFVFAFGLLPVFTKLYNWKCIV